MQFQAGDVVRLKSGGPTMTVSGARNDEVWCDWFPKIDEKPNSGCFKASQLEKIR